MSIEWTQVAVRKRQGLLGASIVILALGVLLLPMAFVSLPSTYYDDLSLIGEPPPTVSDTDWPPPEFTEPVELAAIVYKAQIDRHVEATGATPADERAETGLTVLLAVFGLLLVGATMLWGAIVDAWRWLWIVARFPVDIRGQGH